MILAGINFTQALLGFLYVSITIIVLVILYRLLLKRLSRNHISKTAYCRLSPLENNPAKGTIEFFFITNEPKEVSFEILNNDYQPVQTILSRQNFDKGQHIVRFDTTSVSNGNYFYQLKTPNQQVIRRMEIHN